MSIHTHRLQQETTHQGQDENSKPIGFFPFHQYDSNHDLSPNHDADLDHHFGMSMEVKFALPPDKKLHRGRWVYSADHRSNSPAMMTCGYSLMITMALDVGGIHQPLTGSINFTNDSRFQGGQEYTLRIYYLERGGCDSNCSIRFNMPLTKRNFEFEKQDADNKSTFIPNAKFQLFKDAACTIAAVDDTNGNPYVATADADGKVSFIHVSIGNYYIKEVEAPAGYRLDETVRLIKLTEDGYTLYGDAAGTIPADADSSRDGFQISNRKNPDLTVQKQWQDAEGHPINPENDYTSTFKLQRYVSYRGEKEETTTVDGGSDYTLRIHVQSDESGSNESVTQYDFVRGLENDVTINWYYPNNYYNYMLDRRKD